MGILLIPPLYMYFAVKAAVYILLCMQVSQALK